MVGSQIVLMDSLQVLKQVEATIGMKSGTEVPCSVCSDLI